MLLTGKRTLFFLEASLPKVMSFFGSLSLSMKTKTLQRAFCGLSRVAAAPR